ncbi:hypothetical protein BYT27DRAFT_7111985 [Phlegmacium glaucopus]|nr:hypothetical protein BYT27DRAFT_7111985 [Phlegmacium glaucopus]
MFAFTFCVLKTSTDSSSKSSYHPLFSHPDGDVTLRSTEGTLYRLHSSTLCTSSGLFNTVFSLPQPNTCRPSHNDQNPTSSNIKLYPDILDVYEADFPVEHIFKLIYGIPTSPPRMSFDEIETILALAEKWDTQGPIASLRTAFSSPEFLNQYPIRCYALSKHYGWDYEAKLASTHTLALDLYDPIHAHSLDQLSSKDLLSLLNLHRKRRDMFRQLLNSPERFTAGNSSSYHCHRCGVTELDNRTWRELKNAIFLEMDRRPLGDAVVDEAADWPEALACWEARCTKEGCGGQNYGRVATFRQIRTCIDILPSTVDE